MAIAGWIWRLHSMVSALASSEALETRLAMADDPQQHMARTLLSRILLDLQGRAGKLAFSDERLGDVVTRFGLDKLNAEEHDEFETAVSEMIRVLTHIPSNPSQTSLARLVMESYQFTGNEASGQVNASRQSAARYVAHLVAMAKSNRPRTADGESVALRAPAVSILTGHRGAGKTFFVNYIGSMFHRELSLARTILVRIAFTKDLDFDDNIGDWFFAQTMKVVLRYYDPTSACYNSNNFPVALYDHLREDAPVELIPQLEGLRDTFMREAESDISPSRSQAFATKAFHYTRRQDVSFIFAIDGFDLLSRDRESTERFRRLQKSVGRFLSLTPPDGVAIVVCTRNTSYQQFLQAYQAFGNERKTIKHSVGTPPVAAVIARRMDAIKNSAMGSRFLGYSPKVTERIRDLAFRFGEAINASEPAVNLGQVVPSRAPNLRAVMQALACIFFSFATRDSAIGYRIIEQLLKARMRFPPLPFRIARAKRLYEVRMHERAPIHRYDGFFAPNIFFPSDADFIDTRSRPDPEFWTRRISLQFRILRELCDVTGRISCASFVVRFSERHEEDFSFVLANIDMLENFHCIESSEEYSENDEDLDKRFISVTSHGRNVVFRFCLDPAFLNLSMFRIPVSNSLFKSRLVQYASISREPGRNTRKMMPHGLGSWVEAKIVNSLYLYSLLTESIDFFADCSEAMKEARLWIHGRRDEIIDSCVKILFQEALTGPEVKDILSGLQEISRELDPNEK